MTLLEIIQNFTLPTGIPKPATVFGSTDPQVLQAAALLQEGLEDLSQRGAWERLTYEATWVTTAAEDQGALTTLAPNGFRWLIPQTLWDRTQKLPLVGAMSSQDWQALKAIVITGPRYSFRFRGGNFLVTPAPPAGHTWAFEYISKNFALAADGTTYKAVLTADSDTILLPDQIVRADLRWRWKKEKGLAYAEDFNRAEELINNALGRDGARPPLRMDLDCGGDLQPGIFVPSGSWLTP